MSESADDQDRANAPDKVQNALRNIRVEAKHWLIGIFVAGTFASYLVQVIYVVSLPSNTRWRALGLLNSYAFAATIVGAFTGFLFAIPRVKVLSGAGAMKRSGGAAVAEESSLTPHVLPNTNLEQISDWLTKVLVGATLTQLGRIPAGAGDLFSAMGNSLGQDVQGGKAFAGCIVVSGAGFGFIYAWLGLRILGQRFFDAAFGGD